MLVYNGPTSGPSDPKTLFIADEVQGWIKMLTCSPDFTSCGSAQNFDPQGETSVLLPQGPDGSIYQLTYDPGTLVRIAPATPSVAAVV